MITIDELTTIMIKNGYKIKKSQIRYYIRLGLMTETKKVGGYKTGVKLYFVNEKETVERLELIFELKGKGWELSEISDKINGYKFWDCFPTS